MIEIYKRNLLLSKLTKKVRNVFRTSTSGVYNKQKTILFCPVNASQVNTVKESLIAKHCEPKGAIPILLYQKQFLKFSFDYKNFITYLVYLLKLKLVLKFPNSLKIQIYQTKRVNVKDYSDMFEELLKDQINFYQFNYKGIQLGDLILADTIRFLQAFGPEWEDEKFIILLKKSFLSAIKLVHIYDKAIEDIKPDKLVMSHGIYTTWGALFRLARLKLIPVDVYGGSYRKNTLRFYHNVPNAPMPLHNWKLFENVALSETELTLVDDYLSSRDNQRKDNISLFKEESNSNDSNLDSFINRAQKMNKPVSCMFTNIAWDAYAFTGEKVFAGMMDWIAETMRYFISNDSGYLIVKAHPAEAYFNVPEKYRIRTFLNSFPKADNIYLLDEFSNVKPFHLYEKIDFGLVNISTVALEMGLKGKKVLTSGPGGQYAQKGFTIDPSSKADYFNKLGDLIGNRSVFVPDIKMAKRYLYFRFFREAIPFNIVDLENIYKISDLNINTEEEFINNSYMEVISRGIMFDEQFLLGSPLIEKK